jgi:hypothetical protein
LTQTITGVTLPLRMKPGGAKAGGRLPAP